MLSKIDAPIISINDPSTLITQGKLPLILVANLFHLI